MDKIYCGNAKIVSTNFGDLTKISLSKDDINKIVGYMKSEKLDWINLVVKEKKNKVDGKPTHYLEVDTWKPENKVESNNSQVSNPNDSTDNADESDDLPF